MPTKMAAQFQYTTLAHQTAAVQSLADVFKDVRFAPPVNVQANPALVPGEAAAALRENIKAIRLRNQVTAGEVPVEFHAKLNRESLAKIIHQIRPYTL